MLTYIFLCNLLFFIQAQVIYLNSTMSWTWEKRSQWILNPVVLFCPTVNSNNENFFEKGTLNYDLFTDSENIWRGGTKMKDDDKFYDSRRTKAVNKLILLWREGRPREIQRISNATIKPPKCSLSILTTWWRHHWMHERERRERERPN